MSDNAVVSSRVSGVARLLRGWIVAVLTVLLAAGGHQAAHSIMHGATELIPWELLGFSAALTAPIAVALTGKRLSKWSTAITTVFGQIAFHVLYSLPYSGAQAVQGLHDHHGHHQLAVVAEPHMSHAIHATATADSVMLAAHLLAAALTTVMIIHGESSLLTLIAWLTLAPSRFVLAALPLSITRPKTVLPMARGWIPRPMNVSQTRTTRGPPVLA